MSIGKNIKKLRRERDITQEQLAELLHLTSSAVSQWETDRVMPDITYLPMLANIFRVSADVILGIDVEAKDARIEEIYNEVRELWCTGKGEASTALCRKGLEEFPDAYNLMEELAVHLSYSDDPAVVQESIALFEQVYATSNDEAFRNFAAGNLGSLYMKAGQPDKAKTLAQTIPQLFYTREQCLLFTLRGTEWADEMRNQIYAGFDGFLWDLRNLLNAFPQEHPLFTDEEILELWRKMIVMVETFYEDGDYAFNRQLLAEAYFSRALRYMNLGHTESALDALESALMQIEEFDRYSEGILGNYVTLPPEKWSTSILVRPLDENDGRLTMSNSSLTTENCAMEYMRKLSDSRFHPIRSHPRFCKVQERLQKTAQA